MTTNDDRDPALVWFLAWLGTPDCTCPSGWKGLGRLDGIDLGKGWVRLGTDPGCPHHGPTERNRR